MVHTSSIMWCVVAVAVAHICAVTASDAGVREGFVVFDDPALFGSARFEEGKPRHDAAAWGSWQDSHQKTGWDVAHIATSDKVDARFAMYAAGYAEGALSAKQIWNMHVNVYDQMFGNQLKHVSVTDHPNKPDLVSAWMDTHIWWLRRKTATSRSTDPYWAEVDLLLRQFDGLVAGYNDHCGQNQTLEARALFMLQMDGDLEAVIPLVSKEWEDEEAMAEPNAKCSALIRVAPNNADIFVGHDTWDSYGSMTRCYKHYAFALKGLGSRRVSFSSSPSYLASVDDFYITGHGLVVTETTNGIKNDTLLDLIHAEGAVMSWMRSTLANYNAHTGAEWAKWFTQYNSGTYNDQWMVVDMSRFQPHQPLQPGLLTVLEQTPGYTHHEDVTHVLREQQYWASYNVPYYPKVRERLGFQGGGKDTSYTECPRARIFARDAPKVHTWEDFKDIMRYNDWEHDPLSHGLASDSIASRFDLLPEVEDPGTADLKAEAFGAIDSKVTSWARALSLSSEAVCGPTHEQQPVFVWSECKLQDCLLTSHRGQPDRFDFEFEVMSPEAPSHSAASAASSSSVVPQEVETAAATVATTPQQPGAQQQQQQQQQQASLQAVGWFAFTLSLVSALAFTLCVLQRKSRRHGYRSI